ncbi:MAG: hypothetical protein D6752_07080 [Candidatus Nitrosothermus koennekii]|nr:MAG: hypothetical protein D6752_07080 [Candidatus Nitrosothermus koennekii]
MITIRFFEEEDAKLFDEYLKEQDMDKLNFGWKLDGNDIEIQFEDIMEPMRYFRKFALKYGRLPKTVIF